MKKIIVLILTCSLLLSACAPQNVGPIETKSEEIVNTKEKNIENKNIVEDKDANFTELSDPELLRYMEDSIYLELVDKLNSEEYFIENINSVYLSKEYLEELEYNSQNNIYFGYTLLELEEQFEEKKFIFRLSDDDQTIVEELEEYDDTFDQIVKNVAIGSGVIMINVTVSLVSGGLGAPAVSMILTASAKEATKLALSSGLISSFSAGVVTGIETKDFEDTVKSSLLAGSKGFKWGAIAGTISGSYKKARQLKGASLNGLKMNEAARIQKESGYPLDVIKEFRTIEQYEIAKKAGLSSKMINGKQALVRHIDWDFIDEFDRTNLERTKEGLSALDPSTGKAYELHHIGQKNDSTLAILTEAEHMQGGNNEIWHIIGGKSKIDRPEFNKERERFWKSMAKIASGGV